MGKQIPLAVTLLFVAMTTDITAKTIVFVPPPLTSYFVYQSNVGAVLARMGHDVWICMPASLVQKNLVQDKSVKILTYGEHLGDVVKMVYGNTRIAERFFENETALEIKPWMDVSREMTKIADLVLADQSFVEKVRSLKPDLIVLESILFNMNMVVLPYMLNVPYAFIGTFHDAVLSKIPTSPATAPYPFGPLSDRMTFYERLYSTLFYIILINLELFYDSSLVAKYAPHRPYKSINDLAANAEVFIAEVDHILDYPRTTLPNSKLIGGSSASPAKPLNGEFKKFVDESKNGIIVMSFGSSVTGVPSYITSKIASAFKMLDQRVVWNIDFVSPDPQQIMISKWIPQNDLLGHEKTKLFVSHCGKNGQYEALYHAVPILCLPIYGDQPYNSERVVVKQLGLSADMRTASADELAAMMKELINDKKYSENMKKASKLYRELYKEPKQEAAYWLDHVVKHGGAYMRSSGQEMPWWQLVVLDVIAFLIAVVIFIFLMIYCLAKWCYHALRSGQRSVKRKGE
ncbi:hypothetical protein BsWGS_03708 [Bradybaena similaris]